MRKRRCQRRLVKRGRGNEFFMAVAPSHTKHADCVPIGSRLLALAPGAPCPTT